jgi:hypothetical protein
MTTAPPYPSDHRRRRTHAPGIVDLRRGWYQDIDIVGSALREPFAYGAGEFQRDTLDTGYGTTEKSAIENEAHDDCP